MKSLIALMFPILLACQTTKPAAPAKAPAVEDCETYVPKVAQEYQDKGFQLVDQKVDRFAVYGVFAKESVMYLDIVMPEMAENNGEFRELGRCKLGSMLMRRYQKTLPVQPAE